MIYKIKVHPNYIEDKIERTDEGFIVYVKDKAEKNKANIKVIKLFSKYLNKTPAKLVLKGLHSKNKFLQVEE